MNTEWRDLISAYVDGELDQETRLRVERRLESDAEAREYRDALLTLGQNIREEDVPVLATSLRDKVSATVADDATRSRATEPERKKAPIWKHSLPYAAAATVMLAAFVALMIDRQQLSTPVMTDVVDEAQVSAEPSLAEESETDEDVRESLRQLGYIDSVRTKDAELDDSAVGGAKQGEAKSGPAPTNAPKVSAGDADLSSKMKSRARVARRVDETAAKEKAEKLQSELAPPLEPAAPAEQSADRLEQQLPPDDQRENFAGFADQKKSEAEQPEADADPDSAASVVSVTGSENEPRPSAPALDEETRKQDAPAKVARDQADAVKKRSVEAPAAGAAASAELTEEIVVETPCTGIWRAPSESTIGVPSYAPGDTADIERQIRAFFGEDAVREIAILERYPPTLLVTISLDRFSRLETQRADRKTLSKDELRKLGAGHPGSWRFQDGFRGPTARQQRKNSCAIVRFDVMLPDEGN